MRSPAAAQKIVASIDTSQTAAPVSNYIFGMFIEHIGKTMYGPLWAEMIDDRKFYFPIVSKDPENAGTPRLSGNAVAQMAARGRR